MSLVGCAFGQTASTPSAEERIGEQAPHPWLNDVPSDLSRLVDVGKVRMEVDEAAVRAAKRTALTAFHFKFTYRTHYRWPSSSRSTVGGRSIKLLVRFTEFDWEIEHRIMLSERFRPTKPWETPLLRHEFDHVAVSTDPRLLAMLASLDKAEVPIPVEVEQGITLSSKQIDEAIHAYVVRFQKALEDLVNDRYRQLDRESKDGLKFIADRSAFFQSLYTSEGLENEKFEFLDLVKPAVKKTASAQIAKHYRIRIEKLEN